MKSKTPAALPLALLPLALAACKSDGGPSPTHSRYGFEAFGLPVQRPGADGPVEVRYRLRRPSPPVPGRRYPLLVFLHGAGERGSDNLGQLAHLPEHFDDPDFAATFDAFVLAPQCEEGRRWVEAGWDTLPPPPMAEEPSPMMGDVLAILDHVLATQPVDRDRVLLTGLSMGGQGAWELAVRRPDTFAALAPVCGGGDPARAGELVGLPVWAWHGIDDRAVPFERSALMVEALRAAGGDVRLERLPEGTGHAAWEAAYAKDGPLWPWLAARRR